MSWEDRRKLLGQIEEIRKSRVLLYVTGDRQHQETNIGSDVFDHFVEHLDAVGVTPRISLVIHTRGGDGMAAWSLVNLVRMFCDDLEIIIPEKAHSAGTMIAMAADRIVMTKQATISPIDPSLSHPLGPSVAGAPPNSRAQVSVEAVQGYIDLAKELVGSGNKEAMGPIMLDLARQVHPLVLGESYRRRQQTRTLAEKLLGPHVKKSENRKKIIDFLSSDSGSHDYTLNRREAETLGLPIEKCPAKLYPIVSTLYKDFRDEMKLREPFNIQQFPSDTRMRFKNLRAVIESTAGPCTHFITEGVVVREPKPAPAAGQATRLEDVSDGWRTI